MTKYCLSARLEPVIEGGNMGRRRRAIAPAHGSQAKHWKWDLHEHPSADDARLLLAKACGLRLPPHQRSPRHDPARRRPVVAGVCALAGAKARARNCGLRTGPPLAAIDRSPAGAPLQGRRLGGRQTHRDSADGAPSCIARAIPCSAAFPIRLAFAVTGSNSQKKRDRS